MSTQEITTLVGICHHHVRQIEVFLELGQPIKSEFHSRELAENAKLLSNALYRVQRRSGEVASE